MAFGEEYAARLPDTTQIHLGRPNLDPLVVHDARSTDAFQFYPTEDFMFAHQPGPRLVDEMDNTPNLLAWGINLDEAMVGVCGLKFEDQKLPRAIAMVTSASFTERHIESVGLAVVTHHARRIGNAAVRTWVHAGDSVGKARVEALGFRGLGDSRDGGFTTFVLGPTSGHLQMEPTAGDIARDLSVFNSMVTRYRVRARGDV